MNFGKLIKSFRVQPELHSDFWSKSGKLNPEVRRALLAIAKSFMEFWDFEKPIKIYDITFTGSLANFNYSRFSDIDLHIIVDYAELNRDEELVERIFSLLKAKWMEDHDIKIHGAEVEVYVEDKDNLHESTGVFSLMRNRWIKEPHKKDPVFDEEDVISKAKHFENLFAVIKQKAHSNDFEFVNRHIEKMRDKIKKMRRSGLLKGGEFSTENLAFKLLRRNEFFSRVNDFKIELMDKNLSIEWIEEDFLD